MSTFDSIPTGYTADQWRTLQQWIRADESRRMAPFSSDASAASEEDDLPQAAADEGTVAAGFDRFLQDGQIRIIGPAALAAPTIIVAAILEPTDGADWSMVPFSDYMVPALPSEWQTQLSPPAFKVLSLDLVRQVPAQLLLNTRILGHLGGECTEALRRVMEQQDLALAGSAIIPPESQARLGPPLYSGAADPRNHYVVARGRLIAFVDRQVCSLLDSMAAWQAGIGENRALPLAAGSGTRICLLCVFDRNGRRVEAFHSGYAALALGNPRPDPIVRGGAAAEWEFFGLGPMEFAALRNGYFVWSDLHSTKPLGTGAVSDDGRHARLLNGQWDRILAASSHLAETALLIQLP